MKALFSWWLNDLLLSFFKPKFCKAVFKLILTKQFVNLEFFVADGSIKIVMSDGIVKHIIRTYVVKLSYDRLKNLKVDVSYCFCSTLNLLDITLSYKFLCKLSFQNFQVEVGANFTLKDNNDSYKFISHIKFTTKETDDYLMVC